MYYSADFIMITSLLVLIKKATACQQPLFLSKNTAYLVITNDFVSIK